MLMSFNFFINFIYKFEKELITFFFKYIPHLVSNHYIKMGGTNDKEITQVTYVAEADLDFF